MIKKTLYFLFIISIFSFLIGCHKEISKDTVNNHILAEPNKISPGQAEITGQIVEILPVDISLIENDPCSKVPCRASVRIENITYGPGFPTMQKDTLMLKFNFTLMSTTKEMFPNMDDSYPGLKIGDRFIGMIGFENIMGKNQPEFYINGYKKI